MTDHHPCGAVPVSGVTASAYYCHHHMAWFAAVASYDQTGADDLEHVRSESLDFGPFDSIDDVRRWLNEHLAEHLAAAVDRFEPRPDYR